MKNLFGHSLSASIEVEFKVQPLIDDSRSMNPRFAPSPRTTPDREQHVEKMAFPSQIWSQNPKYPKSQMPKIPNAQNPKYPKSQIPKIPNTQNPEYPKSLIPKTSNFQDLKFSKSCLPRIPGSTAGRFEIFSDIQELRNAPMSPGWAASRRAVESNFAVCDSISNQ